jgi:hypothetical protein
MGAWHPPSALLPFLPHAKKPTASVQLDLSTEIEEFHGVSLPLPHLMFSRAPIPRVLQIRWNYMNLYDKNPCPYGLKQIDTNRGKKWNPWTTKQINSTHRHYFLVPSDPWLKPPTVIPWIKNCLSWHGLRRARRARFALSLVLTNQ